MRLSDSGHLTSTGRSDCGRPVTFVAIFALMALAALGDVFLRDADAVFHLYYLPILLAATQLGTRQALGVAGLVIALVHLADPELSRFRYGHVDVMDLLMFLIVAVVASRLTQDARGLRRLASTDDLTGLHNLRSFESICRELIERQRLSKGSVGMLALDVDRLKQLNDTYGHLTGADAVKHVGEVLARVLPAGGHACRYGGDEFAVVIADASSTQTAELARRIQGAIADSAPLLDGRPFPAGTLAVSVGCASADVGAAGPTAAIFARLFRQADGAMYENKRGRRFWLAGASIQAAPLAMASACPRSGSSLSACRQDSAHGLDSVGWLNARSVRSTT